MRKNIPVITDPIILKQKLSEFSSPIRLEQFQQLVQNQYSKNSLLAMTKDWNHFVSFCISKHVSSLPASVAAVRQFIEYEARTRKYSTIRRYAVTIGIIHSLLSLNDPTTNRKVQMSLANLRLEKLDDAKQAMAFTQEHLFALDERLSRSEYKKDIRDLAIYYVMFECVLKRGELKFFEREQISIDNELAITVHVGEANYSLSDRASLALNRWLTIVNRNEGIVFCSIDRHGNISSKSLNDASIFRILRNAGKQLGLMNLKFSGQSTRIGAAQELAKQGYKMRDIQQFGRWLSPAMPAQYIGKTHTAEQEKMKFKTIKPWF